MIGTSAIIELKWLCSFTVNFEHTLYNIQRVTLVLLISRSEHAETYSGPLLTTKMDSFLTLGNN